MKTSLREFIAGLWECLWSAGRWAGCFFPQGGLGHKLLRKHSEETPSVCLSGSPEEREGRKHAFSLFSYEREDILPKKEALLQMQVKVDPVLLGNPVKFNIIPKRERPIPESAAVLGSFELQVYTGKSEISPGILQKTKKMQGQGARTWGKRPWAPRRIRVPTI